MVKESDTGLDIYRLLLVKIDSQFNIGSCVLRLISACLMATPLFFLSAGFDGLSMSLQAFCIGQTGILSAAPTAARLYWVYWMRLMKSYTPRADEKRLVLVVGKT